jgi:hypothetical protein
MLFRVFERLRYFVLGVPTFGHLLTIYNTVGKCQQGKLGGDSAAGRLRKRPGHHRRQRSVGCTYLLAEIRWLRAEIEFTTGLLA